MQQLQDNAPFSQEVLMEDLNNSLWATEMARRKFRDIAVTSEIEFTGFPKKLI